jgi:putative nucleotidyltransferase with HDIG domain
VVRAKALPKGYTSFDLEMLQLDTIVDFSVYIWPEGSKAPVLYRDRNLPFQEEQQTRLAEANTRQVFIREKDAAAFDRYIERNLDSIIESPSIAVEEKAKILYEASLRIAAEALEAPETPESMKRAEDVVRGTIAYVLKGKAALHQLVSLMAYDYSTYTHSVNVCAIGLALAQEVGIAGNRNLMDFGVGAIFHDVGKTKIAPEILRKRGPLSDEEWVVMKQHPGVGAQLLAGHTKFAQSARAVVLEHHEWVDGTGYPEGKKDELIHPFAKIAAVVDVFDAMTTRRAYKEAATSFGALEVMKSEVGAHLDGKYYRAFVKLLGE